MSFDPASRTISQLKSWLTEKGVSLPPTGAKKEAYIRMVNAELAKAEPAALPPSPVAAPLPVTGSARTTATWFLSDAETDTAAATAAAHAHAPVPARKKRGRTTDADAEPAPAPVSVTSSPAKPARRTSTAAATAAAPAAAAAVSDDAATASAQKKRRKSTAGAAATTGADDTSFVGTPQTGMVDMSLFSPASDSKLSGYLSPSPDKAENEFQRLAKLKAAEAATKAATSSASKRTSLGATTTAAPTRYVSLSPADETRAKFGSQPPLFSVTANSSSASGNRLSSGSTSGSGSRAARQPSPVRRPRTPSDSVPQTLQTPSRPFDAYSSSSASQYAPETTSIFSQPLQPHIPSKANTFASPAATTLSSSDDAPDAGSPFVLQTLPDLRRRTPTANDYSAFNSSSSTPSSSGWGSLPPASSLSQASPAQYAQPLDFGAATESASSSFADVDQPIALSPRSTLAAPRTPTAIRLDSNAEAVHRLEVQHSRKKLADRERCLSVWAQRALKLFVLVATAVILYLLAERLWTPPPYFCYSIGSPDVVRYVERNPSQPRGGMKSDWGAADDVKNCVPCPEHARCGLHKPGDMECDTNFHRVNNICLEDTGLSMFAEEFRARATELVDERRAQVACGEIDAAPHLDEHELKTRLAESFPAELLGPFKFVNIFQRMEKTIRGDGDPQALKIVLSPAKSDNSHDVLYTSSRDRRPFMCWARQKAVELWLELSVFTAVALFLLYVYVRVRRFFRSRRDIATLLHVIRSRLSNQPHTQFSVIQLRAELWPADSSHPPHVWDEVERQIGNDPRVTRGTTKVSAFRRAVWTWTASTPFKDAHPYPNRRSSIGGTGDESESVVSASADDYSSGGSDNGSDSIPASTQRNGKPRKTASFSSSNTFVPPSSDLLPGGGDDFSQFTSPMKP